MQVGEVEQALAFGGVDRGFELAAAQAARGEVEQGARGRRDRKSVERRDLVARDRSAPVEPDSRASAAPRRSPTVTSDRASAMTARMSHAAAALTMAQHRAVAAGEHRAPSGGRRPRPLDAPPRTPRDEGGEAVRSGGDGRSPSALKPERDELPPRDDAALAARRSRRSHGPSRVRVAYRRISRERAANSPPSAQQQRVNRRTRGLLAPCVRHRDEAVARRQGAGEVGALALRRRRLEHAVGAVASARAVRSVVRPSAGRAGTARRAGTNAGAASLSPCSRRSAGPTKSRKHATVESGLPGRPKTSVASRRPNQSGLPGLSRTRQNSSSTPRACSAGLTWSCGPTDTPPETSSTSPASAGLDGGGGRGGVVRDDRVNDHLSARRCARAASQRQPVGLVDPARLGRLRRPRAARCPSRARARPAAGAPRPSRRRRTQARSRAARRAVRPQARARRRARRPRRGSARAVPTRDGHRGNDAVALHASVLDPQHGVGAGRERGPGGDPQRRTWRSAAPRPPHPRRARPRRQAPGAERCRRRARRSRPSRDRSNGGRSTALQGVRCSHAAQRVAERHASQRGERRRPPRPRSHASSISSSVTRRCATSSAAAGGIRARRRGA